jgi:hypothetical protein
MNKARSSSSAVSKAHELWCHPERGAPDEHDGHDEPARYRHLKAHRLREWPVSFLQGPRRTPRTIPASSLPTRPPIAWTSSAVSPSCAGATDSRRRKWRFSTLARLFRGPANCTGKRVLQVHETAEKVASVGRDPLDAETRRPYGRSPGLRAATEANLPPRNGLRIRCRTFSAVSHIRGT